MIFNGVTMEYNVEETYQKRVTLNPWDVNLLEIADVAINTQHLLPGEKQNNGILFFYVKKGQGTIFANDNLMGLKKGDLAIIDMNTNYYITSHKWEIQYIVLSGELISNSVTKIPLMYSLHNPIIIEEFFMDLHQETKRNNHYLVTAKSLELLHELQHNQKNIYNATSYQSPLRASKRYIDNHFMEDINLDELATLANFSKYYFIRLFSKEFGKTPYRYIIDLRINHAKYLLRKTDYMVKDIATLCGFNSEINFNYTFKKEVALTPLNYKKKEV